MKTKLTPGQRRLVAVLLLLLAVSLMAAAIFWPTWQLHQHYDAHIDDMTDHLGRYRRIVALRPAIEEATAEVGKRNGQKHYLKGDTPAVAGAELQSLVTRLVESNSGRLISSQVMPVAEESKNKDAKLGGPKKIAINLQMNTSIVPLQMILHALETNEPYVFIDQLTVRATQNRNYKPVPGVQPEFSVQLTVHGYALAGGTKS
jgi:general secretion pathway protein M